MNRNQCDYCGHRQSWHSGHLGCVWADKQPGGHVACDCIQFVSFCDVCAGFGCDDCNT